MATIVQSAFQGGTTAPTGTFVDYIDEADLQDPTVDYYRSLYAFSESGDFYYHDRIRECINGGTGIGATTGENDWALLMQLERGTYCIDGKGPS